VWRGDLFEDRLEEAIRDVSDILYGCTRLLGGGGRRAGERTNVLLMYFMSTFLA